MPRLIGSKNLDLFNGPISAPTGKPMFYAYRTSSNNNVTSESPLSFDTTQYDTMGGYSTSTNKYTIPVEGLYLFFGGFGAYKNGDARSIEIFLRKNSTDVLRSDCFIAGVQSNNTHTSVNFATIQRGVIGDTYNMRMNATASINIYAATQNNFFGALLIG